MSIPPIQQQPETSYVANTASERKQAKNMKTNEKINSHDFPLLPQTNSTIDR